MRLFSLVTVTTVFLAASAASALEFSVIGQDTFTVLPGDSFTVDIALTNTSGDSVAGITGTISGLAGVANVDSGVTASAHLAQFCSPTQCFGGVSTVDNAFFNPNDLSQGNYNPGDDEVVIVNALALSPSVADGSGDPGLIGAVNEPSDLDVRITLVAAGVGQSVLTVGGSFSDGTNTLPITATASIGVTVIPEPGTALLMGLGLAGLATAGRRR